MDTSARANNQPEPSIIAVRTVVGYLEPASTDATNVVPSAMDDHAEHVLELDAITAAWDVWGS